jgi:hypothetical protein
MYKGWYKPRDTCHNRRGLHAPCYCGPLNKHLLVWCQLLREENTTPFNMFSQPRQNRTGVGTMFRIVANQMDIY